MKNKKYSKGFTLVELLVVIAIIGILAAVVLVSLSSQRQKAYESSALQSLKSSMPYAQDCAMRNVAVPKPNPDTGTGVICTGQTQPVWPTLPGTCKYSGTGFAVNGKMAASTVSITGCGTGNTISCNFDTGKCGLNDSAVDGPYLH